jgi:1-deoxy-D-xylulose-5-phosphate synthase
MATQGLVPFCNVYSTFLQRAYDQVIHDVALQNLTVIFCLDRAGLVGQDGPTHHGIFDLAYLRCIPNLIIFSPMNEIELRNIMFTAQKGLKNPIAIRYPRGTGTILDWKKVFSEIKIGSARELKSGNKVAILSLGPIGNEVQKAIALIKDATKVAHYDMRFVKPIDVKLLYKVFEKFNHIITIEDGCKIGGFGSAILESANSFGYKGKIKTFGIDDTFINQGTVEELYDICGLNAKAIKQYIEYVL